MTAKLTPAVAYYRMSTDRQDKSIDEQRAEVVRFAGREGYRIVREYADPGISGDCTSKRIEFQRMIREATSLSDFEVILCWDIDRFGRFDALEAGYWTWPLREQEVRLITVAHGEVNWEAFTGRILYTIAQEAKHEFLRDISRNVLRGQIANAKAGGNTGRTPWGYDRMLVDPAGKHQRRLIDGEKAVRLRGWRVTLVPTEDTALIEAIRWIFNEFANTTASLFQISEELNRRKQPVPSKASEARWSSVIVRRLLEKSNYCGDLTFGKSPCGRYHYASGGERGIVESRVLVR